MTRSQKVRAAVVAASMAVVGGGGLGHVEATSASPSAPRSAQARTEDCPTLKVGDSGPSVAVVQYRLRSFGYSVVVDSTFGPQTDKAVRHLQRVSGLLEDGIVGRVTQRALGCGQEVASAPAPAPRVAPAPVPTKAPAPRPVVAQGGWHDLAISAGWGEAEWPRLSCIIQRESNGQPGVKNKHSSATGLLQIMASYYPGVNLYDPFTNLRVGHELFLQRGWQPWQAPRGVRQC